MSDGLKGKSRAEKMAFYVGRFVGCTSFRVTPSLSRTFTWFLLGEALVLVCEVGELGREPSFGRGHPRLEICPTLTDVSRRDCSPSGREPSTLNSWRFFASAKEAFIPFS